MKIMMIIKQASSRNILQSEREKKFCYLHQLMLIPNNSGHTMIKGSEVTQTSASDAEKTCQGNFNRK